MEAPLFCDRCSTELTPGAGNFYVVAILAVADPTGPSVAEVPSAEQLRESIEQLLAQLEGVSEQEAQDQVYRRVTLYLCRPCYGAWIENPTGSL
jgi:hypothetical protein